MVSDTDTIVKYSKGYHSNCVLSVKLMDVSGFSEASEENSAVSLQPHAFINTNKRIEFICSVNRCKDDRKRVWRASSGSPVLCFTWRSHLTDFLFIYSFLKSKANILRKESQREPGRSRSAGRTFVMWIFPEIIKKKDVSWCYSTLSFQLLFKASQVQKGIAWRLKDIQIILIWEAFIT